MTDVLDRVLATLSPPTADSMRALQDQGLLPATATERRWARDPALVQPAIGLLAQIDPKHTFTAGRAWMSVSNAQSFFTNPVTGEAHIQSEAGKFTSLFLSFEGLGANRQLIGWFDVRVFGPASASLTIGGTGNPATTVVTRQATGGVRTSIPFAMKSLADGRAIAYVVPTLIGHGAGWFGTTIYGL